MTIRGAIVDEIEQRLRGIFGVASVEVMPSGDPDAFPALVVLDGGQQPSETETFAARKDLAITVEGYVSGGGGRDAYAALNALIGDVVAALITEPPLSGLCETIDEGALRIDVAELASQRRLGFALDIPITFATPRGAA